MNKLRHLELGQSVKWFNAIFKDNGKEYDVVFTSTYDTNIGFHEKELVNVMLDGEDIPSKDPVWRDVEKAVREW